MSMRKKFSCINLLMRGDLIELQALIFFIGTTFPFNE